MDQASQSLQVEQSRQADAVSSCCCVRPGPVKTCIALLLGSAAPFYRLAQPNGLQIILPILGARIWLVTALERLGIYMGFMK
jgi:hypothetical protein